MITNVNSADRHLIESLPRRDTGGSPEFLRLKLGARVMLIRDIDVDDGLVNGVTGTVHSFGYNHTSLTTVNIAFDNSNVGKTLRLKNSKQT